MKAVSRGGGSSITATYLPVRLTGKWKSAMRHLEITPLFVHNFNYVFIIIYNDNRLTTETYTYGTVCFALSVCSVLVPTKLRGSCHFHPCQTGDGGAQGIRLLTWDGGSTAEQLSLHEVLPWTSRSH